MHIISAVAWIIVTTLMLCPPPEAAAQSAAAPAISRLGVRVTSPSTSRTLIGSLYALDQSGLPVSDLTPAALDATIDGSPVTLALEGRPSIALAVGFWLDSSASPQVRDAVANALADGVQGIDVNRDTVAIDSTADAAGWDQAAFTSSATDLQRSLNAVIQNEPVDSQATLEQVSSALRLLGSQTADTRVLLLFVNRPLASAATLNASLGTLRGFAVDSGIQVSIVALPGSGGQGPAEALAEATPGGRVEYVLNATNRQDISRRIGLLLAPAFGARRFELPAPDEGSHTLGVGAHGVPLAATTTFQVVTRPVQIASIETSAGRLSADEAISQATWVEVRPTENAPIDSVEWTLDGQVTQVTSDPWAVLLDPEQLSNGRHDLSARIISDGRAGPVMTTTFTVPDDVLRDVRNAVRSWGVIALLLLGELVVILLFVRAGSAAGRPAVVTKEFPPTLRLNVLDGHYLAPEVIEFPARGKLRIGYHPPFMDNQVGNRDFSRLPYQDIRGDEEVVRDLSRHAACIWRDPKTNDCYVQLGWAGAGAHIEPRPQSQVFHIGRAQDATTKPFRLTHHDRVRLSTGVEYLFNQVGLRDKATPESKKANPLEPSAAGSGRISVISSRPGGD
ncbi:MAG: hypothetical protein JO057_12275 [Chloroflexi bacterium]|nr:hypothetical protein [Chloroflexota bacterium]